MAEVILGERECALMHAQQSPIKKRRKPDTSVRQEGSVS